MSEEAIIKSTGGVNSSLDFWGCNNSPKYHAVILHTYKSCTNKMDFDIM